MSNNFLPLQGMNDICSPEVDQWQYLESTARALFKNYGFSELRTPILERSEVFTHSLGDTTDIVSKEMYHFEDRGGRKVALRPEGTASVMRFASKLGQEAQNARWYYIGPMFRCERPQAGRYRQFHQIGVEAIGAPGAYRDAEMIAMQKALLESWGLNEVRFQINSLGPAVDRGALADRLRERLKPYAADFSEDATRQFKENVFRILDSKDPKMQEILKELPPMSDLLDEESRAYFEEVQRILNNLGVTFEVNPRLVRGLDYYEHTVWEVTSGDLGAQNALSGGGRYRFQFGKNVIEGSGFGIGVERILMARAAANLESETTVVPGVWLVAQCPEALAPNFELMQRLRKQGLSAGMVLEPKGMKHQMKQANKSRYSYALIRGEQELSDETCMLKDMQEGEQEAIPLSRVESWLASRLA